MQREEVELELQRLETEVNNQELGDDESIGNEDEAIPEASMVSILSGVSQLHQLLEERGSVLASLRAR